MQLPERNSDGKLPAYAWPGGYPIVYMARDNASLCPNCANEFKPERDNADQLEPVAFFIHYEGAPETCEHCNVQIDSAYGDPNAAEENS